MEVLVNEIEQKFENCVGTNLVFFTITLKPKLYKFQSVTQYELTKFDIEKYLMQRAFMSTYVVELTSDGNVHYHGIAKFHDKVRLMCFINSARGCRNFGFIKISTPHIEDKVMLHRAACYLVKDLDTTRKVIQRNGWKPELLVDI